MIFLLRNWKYAALILGTMAIVGGLMYVRHIQDKIAVAEAELENQRVQQETLKKALAVKGRNDGKTKTMDYVTIIDGHRSNGWLRND